MLSDELKRHIVRGEIERLNNALDKERSETIKYMDELCKAKNEIERLTIDKRNVELRADVADATVEKLKASHYAEMVDAGMRERRLRRALWFARANSARNSYLKWNLFANFESEEKLFTIDEYDETPGATDGQVLRTYTEWMKTWNNVERKCRAKAEQYK